MSYSIVLALLIMGLPLGERWQEHWVPWRDLPAPVWHWWQRWLAAVWRATASTVAIGVATMLVSLITGVMYFQLLTPGALLANLVLIPAASAVTVGGFASLLCGLVDFGAGATLCNHAAALLLLVIEWLVRVGVGVPGAFFPARFAAPWIGQVALGLLVATLLAGYATGWQRRRGGWWPPFVVVALALIGGLRLGPAETAAERNNHRALEFPGSRSTLPAMKSAYELAMERLAKSDPSTNRPLTAEQKSRLAEIDRVYKGKLAEREIFLKKQLDDVLASQKFEELDKIKQQLASERARLEEEREEEKERVRRSAGSA
jgi:competence protein ComEC